MELLLTVSVAGLAYCVFYLTFTILMRRNIKVRERLDEIEHRADLPDLDPEFKQPFSERMLRPAMRKVLGFFALLTPMNEETENKLNEQLAQAKINMHAKEYRATIVFFSILSVVAFFLYGLMLFPTWPLRILMGAMGIYASLVVSRFYLQSRIKKQQLLIYHQLPDVMDLLSVSVTAGLGFDQALHYVSRQMDGAFIDELSICQREISMGMPRKMALERMAVRCNSEEVQILVAAINQADELGSSLKNVLETQAEMIRLTHKQNVEEKAHQLSIKILIPMVLFILPVTFIIILGPSIPSILEALGNL